MINNWFSNLKSCCCRIIGALSCRFSWKARAAPSGSRGVTQQVWERGGLQGLSAGWKGKQKKCQTGLGHCSYFRWVPFRAFFKFLTVFLPKNMQMSCYCPVYTQTLRFVFMSPKTAENRGKTPLPRRGDSAWKSPPGFPRPFSAVHTLPPFLHSSEWFLEQKELNLNIEKVFFSLKLFLQFR